VVVPPLLVPLLPLLVVPLPLQHPAIVPMLTASTQTPRIARQFSRLRGIPKSRRHKKTDPPLPRKKFFRDEFLAIVPAVVVMVSVAVLAAVPVMVTDDGTEQVGRMAVEGEMLQLRLTTPVNPADGVTKIVDVPVEPSVVIVIAALLLNAKLGEVASQSPTTGASTVS
jgi:hypothetical protein